MYRGFYTVGEQKLAHGKHESAPPTLLQHNNYGGVAVYQIIIMTKSTSATPLENHCCLEIFNDMSLLTQDPLQEFSLPSNLKVSAV